jgi:uncharacterized protein YcbX
VPTLTALNVYPVKSCRGIALEHAELTAAGLAYDREWMLVRETGEFSGDFVTQRELPKLALIEPRITAESLQLQAPGMDVLNISLNGGAARVRREVTIWRDSVSALDEGDGAAAWLSDFMEAPLRLVRFAPDARRPSNPLFTGEHEGLSKFADGYALLVIGSASLADLNQRMQKNGTPALPMNRFRPNLVLEGDDFGPYDEDRVTWLRADGIALKSVKACVRCPIPTIDQFTLARDAEPLLTLASYRVDEKLGGPTFGQNAIVVEGAGRTLRVGDPLEIEWNF